MFAKVSIDRRSSNIAFEYDYNVPNELIDSIEVGSSVFVPFGYDQVFGYVIELCGEEKDNLKDIIDIVNDAKVIGKTNFNLAKELSTSLNCSMANILSLMEPSFIKGQKQQYLYIEDYNKLDANLALALNGKSKVLIDNKLEPFRKQITNEIKNGNITKGYEYFVYGKNKKVKLYKVLSDFPQKTRARFLVINYLKDHPLSTLEDIKVATNVSKNVIDKLIENGSVGFIEKVVTNAVEGIRKNVSRYIFSFEEQNIIDYYDPNAQKPYLLFCNNQDFELNFILKIISDNYSLGKKTVLIYPNALSVEEEAIKLKRYLRNYDIVTYHSKNNNSDNYETFSKVLNNNYDVLLATPQGLMLAIDNVKTIIIGDCDDEMYINESYPYISYKEVAILKAKAINASLIFASASPSISDYYLASIGKYKLLANHQIHNNNYNIVDMNIEAIEANDVVFSNAVKEGISNCLESKKIALLICNNVAFSTQIKCRKCGRVLKCPNCNLPLVYIKKKDIAKCNYCSYEEKMYRVCKCGSTNYISLGFGIEQVVEKIKNLYPSARVIEASSAMLANNDKMENLLQKIEENEVDIIVGTNALTKLTKYDNMDFVGLLYVDSYLNMNNYLGSEYTYNLLAKVASYPNVVIQTYNPTHYAIINGAINNYDDYYKMEIDNRKMLDYPPFKELSMLLIKGEYSELFHFGYYFKKAISHNIEVAVLGPIYDYHLKGVKMMIKHNDNEGVIKIVNDVIKHFDNSKVLCSYHRYTRGG